MSQTKKYCATCKYHKMDTDQRPCKYCFGLNKWAEAVRG